MAISVDDHQPVCLKESRTCLGLYQYFISASDHRASVPDDAEVFKETVRLMK